MDTENPEECKVCITNYDRAKRRPRTLPCGHTFCSFCIAGMIKEELLSCPTCRVQHSASSSTQFPISYDMEAIIRKLKVLQLATMSSTGSSEGRSLIQERVDSTNRSFEGLRQTLSQLERYEANLMEWKSQHEELLARIEDLARQNEKAVKLLEDERSILLYQRKKGQEKMKKLEALQSSLTVADSVQEAVTAIDDSDHYNSEAEDWIQNCCKIFPDVNTVNISAKVREASRRALETINRDSSWNENSPFQIGDTLTIMEKVNQIAPTLSVEILQKLEGPAKAQLEAGRLVAFQEDKERGFRCSRMTMKEGRVHLHVLRHQTAPPNGHSLEHRSLMGLLDSSSTLAFLDFGLARSSSPSSSPSSSSSRRGGGGGGCGGRVYIRLSPDSGLARQFLLLCTGGRGPSFASSGLLGVWNRATDFEMVGGGDYDGRGGAPLLLQEEKQEEEEEGYRRPAAAGTVRALHGPGSARFSISTRDCPGRQWRWAFGRVEGGLDVVRRAAALTDATDVAVTDCGVVLPLWGGKEEEEEETAGGPGRRPKAKEEEEETAGGPGRRPKAAVAGASLRADICQN